MSTYKTSKPKQSALIGVEGGGEMSMQIYLRGHRAWTWREV